MFGTLLVPIVILLLWQAVQNFNKLDWRTGLTGSLSVLAGLALVCIGISILAAAKMAIGKYAPEVGRILGGIAPDQAGDDFSTALVVGTGRCTVLGSTTDTGRQPLLSLVDWADSALCLVGRSYWRRYFWSAPYFYPK